jgi:hypothetical protein
MVYRVPCCSGGFEVLLWYTCGEINDQSLVGMNVADEESHVDTGRMSYHVVQIKVMNHQLMHEDMALGITLKNLKFNIIDNLSLTPLPPLQVSTFVYHLCPLPLQSPPLHLLHPPQPTTRKPVA